MNTLIFGTQSFWMFIKRLIVQIGCWGGLNF